MNKKNNLRYYALLLVLLLVATCLASGTLAAYTTSKTGSDEARVAKWGVTVSVNGEGVFSKTYATDDNDAKAAFASSVVSSTDDSVLAPGTSGKFSTIDVSGSPEVAVSVTHEAALTLTGWDLADGTSYCPVIITVGGEDILFDPTAEASEGQTAFDVFASKVAAAVAKSNSQLAPGQFANAGTPTISWNWPIGDPNANDTYLGEKAANGEAPTITLSITTTVTQID